MDYSDWAPNVDIVDAVVALGLKATWTMTIPPGRAIALTQLAVENNDSVNHTFELRSGVSATLNEAVQTRGVANFAYLMPLINGMIAAARVNTPWVLLGPSVIIIEDTTVMVDAVQTQRLHLHCLEKDLTAAINNPTAPVAVVT